MTPLSTDLLATAWMVAAVILPALPGAIALARLSSAGLPSTLAISFGISLAGAWLASVVGQLAGLGLRDSVIVYAAAVLVIDAALVAWAWRTRKGHLHADVAGLVIVLGVGALALVERPWLAPNVDAFYHIAAARSLFFFDTAMVTDPFYGLGSAFADPTSGSLHVLFAFAARLSHLDPAVLWAGLNVVATALVPAGFWMLVRELGASRWHATASVVAMSVLGPVADFRFAAYPNRVGPVFVILVLAGLVAVARKKKAGFALAAIGGIASASVHTGVAVSLFATVGIVVVGMFIVDWYVRRRGGEPLGVLRRLIAASFVALAAAALTTLPRLWFVSQSSYGGAPASDAAAGPSVAGLFSALGVDLFFYPQAAFRGGDVMVLLGTALALVCIVEAVRRRNAVYAIAGLAAAVPTIIAFNPVVTPILVLVSPYVTWRTLDLLWFGPYIALPLGMKLRPYLGVLTLVGALLTALPAMHTLFTDGAPVAIRSGVMNVSLWTGWDLDVRNARGGEALPELAEIFGDEWPLVATDDMTGYNIAGLLPVRTVAVTAVHAPVFLELEEVAGRRRRAMNELIKYGTTHRRRVQIMKDTEPDYVLMWPGRVAPEARSAIIADVDMFEVVYNRGGVVLLRVLDRPAG